MKPLLSIVIPVYNAAPWLCQCLDSLRAQTFLEWEALLVDDGSSDGSALICKEYAARDKRFHYWREAHAGVVSARRSGVRRASGPMVGFVDADDWVEPAMYQEMMDAAQAGDIVVCGYVRHADGEASLPQIFPEKGVYEGACYESYILDEMLCAKDRSSFDRTPILWNKILPTDLVRKTLEDMDVRMRRGEDALCVYTCLLQAESLVCLSRPLYHYRVHPGSVMSRVGFSNYMDTRLFYQQLAQAVFRLRPVLLGQVDSLFLYLISLGAYENKALLGYSEVREILWQERLSACTWKWQRRVLRMRLKSLLVPRIALLEKQEDL